MIKTFKRFYRFLFRYKKAFCAFGLVLVIATVLENLTPYVYKILIDAIPSQDYHLLIGIVFLFIGIKITANLLNVLSHYLGDKVLIPAAKDARVTIFRRVQDLDFAFHINKSTGA